MLNVSADTIASYEKLEAKIKTMTVAFDVGFKTDQSFFAKLADEKERVIKEINDSASAATAINAMNGLRTELDGIKAHMAEIHKSVTELTEIKSL